MHAPPPPTLADRMRALAAEQDGRGLLWWPVALAAGIGAYFGLEADPDWRLVLPAGAAAAVLLAWRRNGLAALLSVTMLGFALAALEAHRATTPVIEFTTGEIAVTGMVIDAGKTARRSHVIVLAPLSIESLAPEALPRRLRLTALDRHGSPPAGAKVSFKARLAPLPVPVEPGGFDYGRSLWLQGIGGTGRVTAPIAVLAFEPGPAAWLDARLAQLRQAIGRRIHAVMAEPQASVAEALITGERGSIPAALNRSLTASGLFHILSISGLHMWLVAGGVFWTVRAGLALSPRLAQRWPIRKWAAAAALAMGLFYMLLADGGVATERSFIMIAVAFFAVLVDRPALSARTLAVAALAILVTAPHAAIEAGFQMSFMAVLGLVTFHEALGRYRLSHGRERGPEASWPRRIAAWAARALLMSTATTLIAGTLSSIPAAFHFGRLAPYGALANGLAVPVIGLLVMPAALLSAVLMPVGLEALPLAAMEQGLRLVLAISGFVAGLPGADMVAERPVASAILALAAGAVAGCLLVGRARLGGATVAACGLLLLLLPGDRPALLVERTGQNVALRDAAGRLVPALPRRASFSVSQWLTANGEEASPGEAAKRPGWTCAASRCDARVAGRRVAFLAEGEEDQIDCRGLDVLVAAFPLRGRCRAVPLRIDRFDVWKQGAHAVYFTDGAPLVRTARGGQGQRPWAAEPKRRPAPVGPSRTASSRGPR